MNHTQLGSQGPKVSVLGLGTMGMSGMYGPSDRAESIATLHAAIDQGVTLLDTGDFYGMGHNEMLVGEALKARKRDQVQISVKFGALRGPDGQWLGYDSRPAAVRNFVAYSLQRPGGPSDCRSADRVFPDLTGYRKRDSAYLRRVGNWHHGLRCLVAWPDQRALDQGPRQWR